MEIIRNFLPYPGTINVVNDGDLVRVQYSQAIAGAIIEPHYREWGPNPTTGQEEQWTTNALLYVETSDLDDNRGLGAPWYADNELKVPMQHVVHMGSTQISSQYLGAIRGQSATSKGELYVNGRKYGFTGHWDMKVYFMVPKNAEGTEWDIYTADWFPVNIPSLPAMDAAVFYAGVQFNPEQPAEEAPVGAKPFKGKGGGKGNSGK